MHTSCTSNTQVVPLNFQTKDARQCYIKDSLSMRHELTACGLSAARIAMAFLRFVMRRPSILEGLGVSIAGEFFMQKCSVEGDQEMFLCRFAGGAAG